MRKIENDEQLQNSLKWLLEKAKELDHPLMDGEARQTLLAKYDYVSERVKEYQRERSERMEQQKQKLIEPEQKKSVDLSAWLDD
ncbi:hypothetical protein [Brevibacillus sp. HD3.3A]|uniref:hypothetical protein n=1 Tax=Brevibacillus sp. HD3.3A TaxID=2738979 RepID=UPI00156A9277|nr:hypothetical protein [Brevibacillus sp. HD3.3A]UED70742.1 hypothetical protein HP435_08925 [Brevibacillus sp. HD3.3A]